MEQGHHQTGGEDDYISNALDEAKVDEIGVLDESETVEDANVEGIADLVEEDREPDEGEGDGTGEDSRHQGDNVNMQAHLWNITDVYLGQ